METELNNLSVEELEKLLASKRKEEAERLRKEREEYEENVSLTTLSLVLGALELHKNMYWFYENAVQKLNELGEKLKEYGKIRSNSKGGFHLKTKDGKYKLVWKYSTLCDWDERSEKAEELLKDFLRDVVRKRDKELFELIMGLLEKNKEGKLEYSRMQALYAKESIFSDPRWKEAIRLFKESFRPVDSKMRLEFYVRNETSNKWGIIPLNLSGF